MLVTDGNVFVGKAVEMSQAVEMSPAVATAEVVPPHRYAHERASACDLVLFDRWRPPRLPDNAHVIFFDELPPQSDLAAAEERGVRMRVDDVSVTAWGRDHPLLRGLDLKRVYATDVLQLRVPPGAGWDALVTRGERPLLVARPADRRRQIVVGFDPMPSNWPRQKPFFEFLHGSVEWLTGAAAADRGAGDAAAPRLVFVVKRPESPLHRTPRPATPGRCPEWGTEATTTPA